MKSYTETHMETAWKQSLVSASKNLGFNLRHSTAYPSLLSMLRRKWLRKWFQREYVTVQAPSRQHQSHGTHSYSQCPLKPYFDYIKCYNGIKTWKKSRLDVSRSGPWANEHFSLSHKKSQLFIYEVIRTVDLKNGNNTFLHHRFHEG